MDDGYTLGRVGADGFAAFGRAVQRGFHEEVDEEGHAAWRPLVDLDRTVTVTARDGQLVGTGMALALPLSMPDAPPVPCAAVTAVTVRPDHRRRGLLHAMMDRLLADAVAAGEPVAALFATEGTIYGRYGFGPAGPAQGLRVTRDHLATVDGDPSLVQVVDVATAKATFPLVGQAHARVRGGSLQRPRAWWDLWLDRASDSTWRLLVPGRGYATFTVTEGAWANRRPDAELKVGELVAVDAEAAAALWSFLASVDLVATVACGYRPADDPLPYLVAAESLVDGEPGMALHLRLVDLPAALTARGYDVTDRLVLEVGDDRLPANAGRWALEATPGGSTCRRTDRAPDVVLSTERLATLVLGGVRAGRVADAGWLPGTPDDVVRRLDRLFATRRAPWQPFDF